MHSRFLLVPAAIVMAASPSARAIDIQTLEAAQQRCTVVAKRAPDVGRRQMAHQPAA